MDLKIYATGDGFSDTADLKAVIDLLNNYQVTFDTCLRRSCVTKDVFTDAIKLRLSRVNRGSLDIALVTDVAAAVAPIAPQIFGYAWNLYKSAYDLIIITTNFFKDNGRPMTINVTDSPGATVNVTVVGGDQVHTTKDILRAAQKIHKPFNKIAGIIRNGKAESITLGTANDNLQPLEFNTNNQNSFKVQEEAVPDDEPIEFECSIYRFNKKSLNGYLEYFDEDGEAHLTPFFIEEALMDNSIEALRSPRTIVTAYRKMTANALGETRIKKFNILSIANLSSDD